MVGVRAGTRQPQGIQMLLLSQGGGAEKTVQRGRIMETPLQQVESRMSQVQDMVGTHRWAEGHLKG